MDPRAGRFASVDMWSGSRPRPKSLNKYAYANMDPVNVRDPSGRMGLLDVSLGIGAGMTIALAASHWGPRKLFGSPDHLYDFTEPVCQVGVGRCTLENVFKMMLHLPAPLWAQSDLLNKPVKTGDWGFAGSWLPGGLVKFEVAPTSHQIKNITLPPHLLCCGSITRWALASGGGVSIRTLGEGRNFSGALAVLNERYGKWVFQGLNNQVGMAINFGWPVEGFR